MRQIKSLGIVAFTAVAVMAWFGYGTGSALGRICSTATNPCTSPWATPTTMEFSLKFGSSAKLTDTSANTLDTCTSSSGRGSLTSNPAGSGTASGTINESSGGGCTVTTDGVLLGGLKFTSAGSGNATVTANAKIEITVNVFSSCNYGVESGTNVGTTTAGTGTSVVLTANAVAKKLNGGFLCPETTKYVAVYVLTSPAATYFYVSSS
jgi:hypothetical protein